MPTPAGETRGSPYSIGAADVPKNGYIFMSSRGLLRPLRGSGFALGQPDRLRRQAHLELRLADVAARDHQAAGNPISAIRSKPNKKDPPALGQKVLIRHKKSASTIDAQLPFEKV